MINRPLRPDKKEEKKKGVSEQEVTNPSHCHKETFLH